MKRNMILAVAAVLAVAAAGPVFADPGSGGRGRGSQSQHDRDRGGWDNDRDWDDDDDGYRNRPGTPRIDRREDRLEMRIRHGLRSGALTRREASTLRNQLAQIHRQEAQFKRDGRITYRERQILARATERLSLRIDRELADWQNRNSRYGRRG